MKNKIETMHIINAPLEKVWSNIKRGDGVDLWLPIITACKLEGSGIGAKRICTTEQGPIHETILTIDDEQKVFQYRIDEQSLMPISSIVGTMKLNNLKSSTELEWTIEFEIENEEYLDEVKNGIQEIYAAGAKGLEAISM